MEDMKNKILELVLDKIDGDKQGDTRDLIENAFSKIGEGGFDMNSIMALAPQLISLIKPEHKDEIMGLISGLGKDSDGLSGIMSMLGGADNEGATEKIKDVMSLFGK